MNKEVKDPSVTEEKEKHETLGKDKYYDGVPDYMIDVYDWAYVNPKKAALLDRNIVVWVLLFLNAGRLMKRYLQEIKPGMRVWQVAHVYGDLVTKAADRVGPQGEFVLTDVTPVQLEHAEKKIGQHPWVKIIRHDAATFKDDKPFDLSCNFFLLHEIPDEKKYQVVDRILESIGNKGKAVFVDYDEPAKFHPIRPILKFVNWWLEPFAEAMWNRSIKSYASYPERYKWHHESIFGGVYQCVTVEPLKEA